MGTEAQRIAIGKQRTMRTTHPGRYVTLAVAFLASVTIGYAGYQRLATPSAAPAQLQTVTVQRGNIAATVSATGSVVANQQSKLTFATSGTVTEVRVALGDKVKAGQVLAKLDTSALEVKVAQAKSNLRAAQIKLEDLKAGATPEEIAAAKAALTSAQAKYDDLMSGASEADFKAAEQSVSAAQANLAKAQVELAKLKAGPTQDEITVARADLEKKQATLQKAQADYDRVSWRGDIAARQESVALQQATTDYQASLANYNIKVAPPSAEDLAAADKGTESATAALASARSKLDQLKAGPKQSDVLAAQSSVVSSRSQLALKIAPSELDVAAQQEAVNNSQLSVRSAELDLAKATLTAPFDGVVAAITVNSGEQTSGSSNVTLVNPSSIRVDVTVDETDLSKLSLGKTAQVAFDALPDTRLSAKVVAISPSANVQQGVVTYLVSLKLDTGAVYLPPGMTANVNIVVDQRDNVLLVPNRAVKTQGRNRVVDVMVNGKPDARTVTIGMSNDQMTEITEGLQEGDVVAIRTTTTAPPRPAMGSFGPPTGGGAMVIRK